LANALQPLAARHLRDRVLGVADRARVIEREQPVLVHGSLGELGEAIRRHALRKAQFVPFQAWSLRAPSEGAPYVVPAR
jgi:hypothetical protein